MTNKNWLKILIKEQVKKIFKEQEPEAPESAPFGQYLWADPKHGIRRDKIKEPDTKQEREFYQALMTMLEDNYSKPLTDIINKYLRPLKQQQQYRQYIVPPNKPVYRGLILSLKEASSILNIPEEELIKNAGEPTVVSAKGTLQPGFESGPFATPATKGKKLMSWTVDLTIASSFALENFNMLIGLTPERVAVVIISNPSEGDFYLNPLNIIQKFEIQSDFLEQEKEVVSYGPVNFSKVIYYIPTRIERTRQVINSIIEHVKFHLDTVVDNFSEGVGEMQKSIPEFVSQVVTSVDFTKFSHFSEKDLKTILTEVTRKSMYSILNKKMFHDFNSITPKKIAYFKLKLLARIYTRLELKISEVLRTKKPNMRDIKNKFSKLV